MYRNEPDSPKGTTTIAFRAERFSWKSLLGILAVALYAVAMTEIWTAVHLRCTRAPGTTEGTCTLRKYRVAFGIDATFSTRNVRDIVVKGEPSNETGVEAIFVIGDHPTYPYSYPLVAHPDHFLGGREAFAMQSDFRAFLHDPSIPVYDHWILPPLSIDLFAFAGIAVAGFLVFVTVRSHRRARVRLVLDGDRAVVRVGSREIPLAELGDVVVEELTLPSKERSKTMYRLAFVLRDGRRIAITEEHWSGARQEHEALRAEVLRGLGREPA